MTGEILDRLAGLDACAVSDALDRLDLPGAALGLGPLWAGARLAGRVRTISAGPAGAGGRHIATETIATASSGEVIVIANAGRADVSCWGGILTVAAMARGVPGVVVDGAARDVDTLRELSFPVFARAAVTRTARGRISQVAADRVIDVAGVTVSPGDLVIADGSGVVFIPQRHAEAVLRVAGQLRDREAAIEEQLRAGAPVVELMSDASLTRGLRDRG